MRAWLVPLVVLATLAAPTIAAAPFVPDVIQGFGAVSWFQVRAFGLALSGGAHDYLDICAECYIRFTTTSTGFTVVDANSPDGAVAPLSPGLYELREFRGLYGFSQTAPGSFFVDIHGVGRVVKLG